MSEMPRGVRSGPRDARVLLYAFKDELYARIFYNILFRAGYNVELAQTRTALLNHLTSDRTCPDIVIEHADAEENWPSKTDRYWNTAGFRDGNRELFQLSACDVKRIMVVETFDLVPPVPYVTMPIDVRSLLNVVQSQLGDLPLLYGSVPNHLADHDAAIDFSIGATDELLARCAQTPALLREINWRAFEELVARIFERSGYEVQLQAGTKDGGVDIVAVHRDLAYALFLVQCKHTTHNVGVKVVRELYGVTSARHASGGIVVTTASFTTAARQFAAEVKDVRLNLHDLERVVQWTQRFKRPKR